jgi:hypothetical protein
LRQRVAGDGGFNKPPSRKKKKKRHGEETKKAVANIVTVLSKERTV